MKTAVIDGGLARFTGELVLDTTRTALRLALPARPVLHLHRDWVE